MRDKDSHKRIYICVPKGSGYPADDYDQLSKALCGKENAALGELLQAASQLKSRLAQVERERDAALDTLHDICGFCKGHCLEISGGYLPPDCKHCMIKNYRPENTKEG